jgi:hypothetical protein
VHDALGSIPSIKGQVTQKTMSNHNVAKAGIHKFCLDFFWRGDPRLMLILGCGHTTITIWLQFKIFLKPDATRVASGRTS